MEQTAQTSVKILGSVIQSRGLDYLREGGGQFFVNAFSEMGGEKQDVRLLRYLTECGAHEELLNAASLTPAMQRAYYSQAVQKLCDKTLIPEALAHRVCGIFWQAVYGKEPPIVPQEPKKDPEIGSKIPVRKSEKAGMSPEELYQRGMTYYKAPNLSLRQWWPSAAEWLEAAAARGHLEAQIKLGFMYSWRDTKVELGIRDADVTSAFWFRKAAEQGNPNAQVHLSRYYRDGTGVAKDYDQALYWCHKAAEQNDTDAMNELRYLYGYRLNKPQLALEWCKKAAELGRAECQWRLGTMYEDGFGTDVDYEKALYWYRKAAAQGDRSAADRIPQVEGKLKKAESIEDTSAAHSVPPRASREPYSHKQEKKNGLPRVWKLILKGLSAAQIAVSLMAIVLLSIQLVSHQEWTCLAFMIAHLGLIYEANKAPEGQKESPLRYVTAVLLLFLAAVFSFGIVAAAVSGDRNILCVIIGIFGSAPLLARMGLECIIGCRLNES